MKTPVWNSLKPTTADVPAKGPGLWTQICEYVEGPVRLKVKATGKWKYRDGRECGPDGDISLGFSQDMLLPSAPRGALIAKIGGSTADKPDPAKQMVFAVGSECVVSLETTNKGGLFLTMNDEVSQFAGHDGSLAIEIWESTAPTAASP
jgi:hypothetical protein